MITRRHIIPIIVFLVSLAIGNGWIQYKQMVVGEMIMEAEEKGMPVVALGGTYDIFVGSIDEGFVKLYMPLASIASTYHHFFTEEGFLRAIFMGVNPTNLPEKSEVLEFKLPQLQAKRLDSINWDNSLVWQFHSFLYNHGEKEILSVYDDHIAVDSLLTGRSYRIEFNEDKPWSIAKGTGNRAWSFAFSSDSKVLMVVIGAYGKLFTLLRYDLNIKKWTDLGDFSGTLTGVGPEGNFYSSVNFGTSPPTTEICDGHTGAILKSVQGLNVTNIGRRWVACLKLGSGKEVILFDMQDNWKEYRIKIPFMNLIPSMAMYEP